MIPPRTLTLILSTLPLAISCTTPGPPRPPEHPPSPQEQDHPPEHFFDWTHLQFPPAVHAARRQRALSLLRATPGSVLLVPARDGFSDGSTFRQLSDFLYLTGLELPSAVLALDADAGATVLFAPERDLRFENPGRPNDFPGCPLATDPDLARVSGLADIRPYGDLASFITERAAAGATFSVNLGRGVETPRLDTDFVQSSDPGRTLARHLRTLVPDATITNAYGTMARLRMVKGPEEIARIREACAVTAAGIRAAARHVRPGVDERTLEAEFEAECKRRGAQRLAFDSIVKSGPNSLWPWRILAAHYDRRNRALADGDLVIFDVGCELDHYASDVGRTFPASGRFTDAQRARLELSTMVADAIIAAARPGVTLAELQAVAEARIPPGERRHMQTGLYFGHHVGLDVGDPSLDDAPLAPGMVFTVEPWYYDHEDGIAVFVEDVILVVADGAENLTRALPRGAPELEAMVRR